MARLPPTGSSDRSRPPLEANYQTGQRAPDFQAWLHKILEDEIPYVRRISSLKASIPKH